MTIYSLYKKTHNKTGLMYLGRTTKDPFKYNGSGLYWTRHLKKHGNDHTTEVIGQYDSLEQLAEAGLAYSIKHDIVASSDWANMIAETGTGIMHTDETKAKLARPGRKHSEETKAKIAAALRGKPPGNKGKPMPAHQIALHAERLKKFPIAKGILKSEQHKQRLADSVRRYHASK